MRYLALATAAAAIALASSGATASVVVVPIQTNAYGRAPGFCGAGGRPHGLFGGRHGAAAARATYTLDVQAEDLRRPCPYPPRYDGRPRLRCGHLGLVGRMLHHETPHCIPSCYAGYPCGCCDHSERYIRPGTPAHLFYSALIRSRVLPSTLPR